MSIDHNQEGEGNTSDLADPMIMAIMTSRQKKRANGGFLQPFQLQMVLYLDLEE